MPLRGGHAHAPSAEVLGEYNHLTPIPRENLDWASRQQCRVHPSVAECGVTWERLCCGVQEHQAQPRSYPWVVYSCRRASEATAWVLLELNRYK